MTTPTPSPTPPPDLVAWLREAALPPGPVTLVRSPGGKPCVTVPDTEAWRRLNLFLLGALSGGPREQVLANVRLMKALCEDTTRASR